MQVAMVMRRRWRHMHTNGKERKACTLISPRVSTLRPSSMCVTLCVCVCV